MRTLALCLIFVLSLMQVKGQYFSNRYVEDRPAMALHDMIVQGDTIYALGVTTTKTPPYTVKSLFMVLGLDGTLYSYTAIGDSFPRQLGTFFNYQMAVISDSSFRIAGYTDDSVEIIGFSATITKQGKIITYKTITDSVQAFFRPDKLAVRSDLGYYLGVNHQPASGEISNVVLRLSASDSILWRRQFGIDDWAELPKSLIELENGHIVLGTYRYNLPIGSLSHHLSNYWFIEMDSSGNVVRQKLDTSNRTFGPVGLKRTSDGGYVFGCDYIKESLVLEGRIQNSIIKLDSNFRRQWVNLSEDELSLIRYYINDVIISSDGMYLACGRKGGFENDSNIIGGWIRKVNQTGQTVWKKQYTAIDTGNTINYLRKLQLLPNGQILACGYAEINAFPAQQQQAWLLLVDSNGCVIENCFIGLDYLTGNQPLTLSIYPNPSNGMVNIMLPDGFMAAQVIVSDVSGVMVLSTSTDKPTAQLQAHLPHGIYFVKAVDKAGLTATGKWVVN
jgi:hypothetical protein